MFDTIISKFDWMILFHASFIFFDVDLFKVFFDRFFPIVADEIFNPKKWNVVDDDDEIFQNKIN